MTLKFLRNKTVEVEPLAPNELKVVWRLSDDLTKLDIRIKVQIPSMEILEAKVESSGYLPKGCRKATENLSMRRLLWVY